MTSASSSGLPGPATGTAARSGGVEHAPSALGDYGRALLRRWWLVLLGVVVGAVAALGYLAFASKTYTSTANVQVTATGVNDSALPISARTVSNVDMDTEAQVVKSDAVSALVAKQLKVTTSPSDLSKNVKVTVPPNSAVLNIAFEAHSKADAQLGAQAFADSYLAHRTAVARGILAAELNNLRTQLPALTNKLQDVTGQTAVLPISSAEHAYAVAQAQILQSQIDDINAAIGPLLQQGITPGRVITPADLPSSPSSPQKAVVAASGLLGGLLLGAVLAVVAVRRDRRIHRASEVSTEVGLPLLADVPSQGVRTVGLLAADSRGAAAVRELRDRLVGAGVERTVLIVPISGGAGGSLVAVNLAASLAADGSSCALVCASPNSSATLRLGLPEQAGLSDALAYGFTDVRSVLQPIADRKLSVLVPGMQAAALPDRLHGPGMREILRALHDGFDHVVIEAPVWTRGRSALVLGRAAQIIVLVAEAHVTTREQVIEAAEMLTDSGAAVFGVVVVPRLRGTGVSGDGPRVGHRGPNGPSVVQPLAGPDPASVPAGATGAPPTAR